MSEALNREYLELCGWTEWRWFDDQGMQVPVATPPGQRRRVEPPKLHQDASACIAELDRVCGEQWTMDRDSNGFYCADQSRNYTEMGATFTEAALKCLIAANKRESETT